ncbi:MAG: hypothetical protein GX130_00020 [Candidatus Hydrogenedens sp.]|jgi:ribosomal 30S subunit maturation factor RimM|nr:hypothetical protein [Candidatus Hydrogenedens sp.]
MSEPAVAGQILGVDAAKRMLRVQLKPEFIRSLDDCERLWIITKEAAPRKVRVEAVQRQDLSAKITLTPGVCRDDIQSFQRAEIALDEKTLVRETSEQPEITELKGMKVQDEQGRIVGVVFETIPTPAGGVIRMSREDGRTAALPFIPEVIRTIDLEEKTIVVGDPEPFIVMDDAQGTDQPTG